MHLVGKILIGLLAIAAGIGFITGARLVNARGAWMNLLQVAKANDEKSAQKLAAARQDFEEARADLEREMLRWDHYYSPLKGTFDTTNNALLVSAGKTIGIQPNKELFAFQLDDSGNSSTYIGSFNVAEAQANESALKATFPVRAQDVPGWNGQNFRLRKVIPSSLFKQIADLQGELVKADELLKKQEKNLATQSELATAAKEQRDTRIAELLGGKGIDTGLVAGINQADDRRNASLLRVDDLRRKISQAGAHVKSLIQENNTLAASLPGQTPRQQAEAVHSQK